MMTALPIDGTDVATTDGFDGRIRVGTDAAKTSGMETENLVIVKPCAWCFPGDTFFDRFPETRGEFSLSHGICPRHYELFLQTISPPPKQRGDNQHKTP